MARLCNGNLWRPKQHKNTVPCLHLSLWFYAPGEDRACGCVLGNSHVSVRVLCVCVCVCEIFMTGAVPQAHGLEFHLTEQPVNCSWSRLVSRALAIGGQGYSTLCVPGAACMCVCVFLKYECVKNETHLSSLQIWQLGVAAIDLNGSSCICATRRKLKGLIKQQGLVQCHFSCASEMSREEGGSKRRVRWMIEWKKIIMWKARGMEGKKPWEAEADTVERLSRVRI